MSMIPFLDSLEKLLGSTRAKTGFRPKPWPIFGLGAALLLVSTVFMFHEVAAAIQIALFLAPLWLPIIIVGAAWRLWLTLKRSEFIAKQTYVLLEIKPPRGIEKTPLAMETVFAGLHHGPGEGNWYDRFIKGGVRPWWSFEIVSLEGQVHLYVWTRKGFRRIIEAQIYSQYPGAQVVEAPDYTRLVSAIPGEWAIWGCDFVQTDKDPVPIKTYVEYGLDKVQKEPEQVDPMANLIEFMGSMRKGEYLWLQLVIRTHKGEKYNKMNKAGKAYTWKDEAQEMIEKIRKETRQPYFDAASGKEMPGFPNPTKGQSEKIAAIERNIGKLPFDVGARGIYLARPEVFDAIAISGLTGVFKQFSSAEWNGLRPSGWMTQFEDYPWELGASKLKTRIRTLLVEAYRRRQFYHEPFIADTMVMSTEELATVFHIPSGAVTAPSLARIQSSTSEAPPNLPV